jgi:hypothetical protein
MLKKNLCLFALIFCASKVWCQSYYLPEPERWEKETFSIPIEFAPNIPFTGSEEVRFSPGWGNIESEEHWSYCFLWWIEPDSKINAPLLKKYLEEYYGGLVKRNVISRKIESAKIVPTNASIHEGEPGKSVAYAGTVNMLDYMSQRPLKLNVTVQIKDCTAEGKKAVFFSISPQPATHPVWKQFVNVWDGFRCKR